MDIELSIDSLTVGGRGLGRCGGKAVFVPLTAPGDLVRCRVTRQHRHYDEAELLEILLPGPGRRPPPCPVYGRCGGCQWQHLDYPTQAEWKTRLFAETLRRAGIATDTALRPLLPAPHEYAYRCRVQIKCRQTDSGFVAGFYRHASHYVVDTGTCLLASPAINRLFAFLRNELPCAPHPEAIPQIDLAVGDDGQATLLCHVLPDAVAAAKPWLAELAAKGGFAAALQSGRKASLSVIHGDPRITFDIDEPSLQLSISAGGFSQVNPDQNRALVAAVLESAGLHGYERVLDLFCGAGNFSLPLARRAGEVIGVEDYAPAIDDARVNALRLGLNNVRFLAESAEGALATMASQSFDVVLLDPPRTGAYPVMRRLLENRPQKILYVSCDPATLARDLLPLIHHGYHVISSQPFDLFPQTWHIESLTLLSRSV